MTNPFDNLVGLKGVTTDTPQIWLNDIPGMSTELVEAVADKEDRSTNDPTGAVATYDRVKRLALEQLRSILEGELSKSADFQYTGTAIGSLTGEASDLLLLPNATYAGYSIICPLSMDDELFVSHLLVDSASLTDIETVIKAFSPSGKELFTKSVTVHPDYNEIECGFTIRSQFGRDAILFIGIDASELALRILGTGQSFACSDSTFDMQPATMDISGSHNLGDTVVKTTTGIMLRGTVRRSLIDVIGKQADRFKWAYAHVLASCLMTEKLASPRINLFTNTNRAFTEELEPRLLAEAKKQICTVSRSIVIELRNTPVMKSDPEFQYGYTQGGFV